MFCRRSLSDGMKYTDKTRGVLSSWYYTRPKFDYQFRIFLSVLRHTLQELIGQSWEIHAPSLRTGWSFIPFECKCSVIGNYQHFSVRIQKIKHERIAFGNKLRHIRNSYVRCKTKVLTIKDFMLSLRSASFRPERECDLSVF